MNPKTEFKSRWCGQFKNLLAVQVGVFLSLVAASVPAQTYTILHTFGTNTMGLNPYSQLVQGPDGALYGTTEGGGSANRGQVFKVNPDGSAYTVLKDFTGSDGVYADAGLVLSGTTLYGTTSGGGSNDNGTVFKVNTDGTGFSVLKQFTGYDGANPHAKLTLSGAVLYGTTGGGGAFGNGTVFKINTDGTDFAVLRHFTGNIDGGWLYACLVASGSTLYGTANGGGSYGNGTVFKVNTDGSGFTVLRSFTGGSDGGRPSAGLSISGTTLYGTASSGGNSGNGTLFRLNTDGSGFTVLKDFTYAIEGAYPYADLVLSGSTLYGTTVYGGSDNSGQVFMINTDGSGFSVLKDFTNSTDGVNPSAGLVLSGTTLYGTTYYGGNNGYGTVFKVETDGSDYSVVTHFAGGDGVNPWGNLALSGTTLYGATCGGGGGGYGTLFKVNTDGSGYAVFKDFSNPIDGANPNDGLVLSGTTLYGTTFEGGENGYGTVFKVETDGSGYTVLKDFTNLIDGVNPCGGLVLSGAVLYGTARGGNSGFGTVFRINTDGNDFAVLKHFAGSDGRAPNGYLVLSGTTLYGTTWGGGDNDYGVVFKVNTDGNEFTVLNEFTGGDGGNPGACLALCGSTLCGTTVTGGGGFGNGTLFKVNTDGSGYVRLKDFIGSDGSGPLVAVILSGTTLYGITGAGGYLGFGTVFQIDSDGSGFATLKYFTGGDGAYPQAGLVLSGTTLYGATGNGGGLDSGALFSLSLLPGIPQIQMQPQSQTVQSGWTVDFSVVVSQIPTPAYQWFSNGNAIDGATNVSLELTTIRSSQAGNFTLVVTNSYGSVTSLVATLTVQDPFVNGQPGSQLANAGDTVHFSVDAGGTEPLSFQWFKEREALIDGGNISGAQTATLTLSNVLRRDSAEYSVSISNANDSMTSEPALLVVQDPFIRLQPWSQSIHAGESIEFSVLAQGTALNYQWQKDGLILNDGGNASGAQTPTLTLDNVSTADAAGYSVIVSNNYRSVVSAEAGLTVNPAGNYSILHSFTGSDFNGDGSSPHFAELVVSGSTLYGTTADGGSNNAGTVFRLNTDRSGYELLHSFSTPGGGGSPVNADGWEPAAGLVLSDATLYGTAQWGGDYNWGTIFKFNPDGSDFTVLKSFTGDDGRWEVSALTLSGTTLYGTRAAGGSCQRGTVFKINTDGSGFTVLHNFGDVASDGYSPDGKLVLLGNTFYGVTRGGGSSDRGTVFKINNDGSDYDILHNFTATQFTGSANTNADGAWPNGGLVLSGSTLYGTTSDGGINGVGTVFKVNADGSDYGVLHNFAGTQYSGSANTNADGAWPNGGLVLSGLILYGTADGGGINGDGTIFGINTDGTHFRMLKQFTGDDGLLPRSGLLLSGSTLYGTTMYGGMSNNGVVFGLSMLPCVSTPPQSQTVELGSSARLEINAGDDPTVTYLWSFNGTNLISCGSDNCLLLTNADFSMSGTYTVVITNVFGAVTSAPIVLQVIPAVERRPVPSVMVTGEAGSLLNVQYTDALDSPTNWLPLELINLTNPPQYCFDPTTPLPPQRFYRAWQTGAPSAFQSLNLNMVPAITLTGSVGNQLRLDCINQIGPTDAWVTLDTITLTNTSQLYFDTSAVDQPARLYRIVPVP